MPNRGKRGSGRGGGRGGGRGAARGRGRGSIGGGGRGRNRELIPSAVGYVYKPRSNVDDSDDFRVYGQFSSDETDSGAETSSKKQVKQKPQTKPKDRNLGFVKESRPSFGSNYDDHYDDAMDRAGLGMSSSAAAKDSNTERFAKGKSKYYKTVLFTKSSSSANEKVIIKKVVDEEAPSTEQQAVEESFSQLTIDDFIKVQDVEKELATQELLSMLGLSNTTSRSASPSVVCSQTEPEDSKKPEAIAPKKSEDNKQSQEPTQQTVSKQPMASQKPNVNSSSTLKETELSNSRQSKEEEESNDEEGVSSDESDDEEYLSEETDDDEIELFYEDLSDDEDDILLKEDMAVMNDFMEHYELEEGEDLNDILAWSAMQEGNLALMSSGEEEIYDYATLDKEPAEKTLSDFEEETASILRERNKIEQNGRKKYSHKTRVDDIVVDPEIFGQTLKAALADVPPGLRPGVRRWYEKQQRKEERQKKKDEAKAHKRENKKNNKGKAKEEKDEDFTNQMARIDDRIRDFIQDDTITSFQFSPMTTNVRRQLHVLAAAYNLKSKSSGGGGSRCTIVTKTTTTYIPKDRRYISRFLTDIQTNMDEQNRIIGKNRSKGTPLKGKKKYINMKKKNNDNNDNGRKPPSTAPKDKRGDSQFPAGPSHGTVVAYGAAPIGETNVGHRMLAAMGWKQGEALGSKSEGIIAPIEAIIRKKGRGLGS